MVFRVRPLFINQTAKQINELLSNSAGANHQLEISVVLHICQICKGVVVVEILFNMLV